MTHRIGCHKAMAPNRCVCVCVCFNVCVYVLLCFVGIYLRVAGDPLFLTVAVVVYFTVFRIP